MDLPHGQDATPFDGDRDDRRAARHGAEGEATAEAEGAVAHERDRHDRPEMKRNKKLLLINYATTIQGAYFKGYCQ